MAASWTGARRLTDPSGVTAGKSLETQDVARAAAGDEEAFERLYRRHLPRVHGLVRRMLDGEEAEEVTQDVFVRAWQKLGTFRGTAAFGTWLYRVAVSVVLARRKTWGRQRHRFISDPSSVPEPAAPAPRPEQGMDLDTGIAGLPPGARQVLLLHDVAGYRHEEIAAMLGVTLGTSKSQLHRARMALRRYLDG